MTGFGRGVHAGARFLVEVEMRSVNHRFREIVVRVPPDFGGMVEPVRERIARVIERGRVDVFISLSAQPGTRSLKVDMDLALAYYRALESLREHLGLAGPITLDHMLQFRDILIAEPAAIEAHELWADIEPALAAALADLCAMREREGQALADDMRQRLERLDAWSEALAARAPVVVEHYRRRLRERFEALGSDPPLEPERLEAEIVLFAERSDITEELVRLRSHLRQMEQALAATGAIGRKLEFLLQEAHREVNTIGSKAHDPEIAAWVVEMKTELEKLREQAQNIE